MKTLVLKNPDEIYFIADTHLHHTNIIEYCDRPFGSVEEMDKTIISNWNKTIPHGSVVFILGDFCWGNQKMWKYFLSQLSGVKYLIQGNHDKDSNIATELLIEVIPGFLNLEIKDPEIGSQRISLCHYPMLSWYQSHKGSWQLYGHVHGKKINTMTTQMDVGVDCNNFIPVSYQAVKTYITKASLK